MNTPPIEVLLTQPLPEAIDAQLVSAYQVHRLYQQPNPQQLLEQAGPRIRGVVTGGAKGLPTGLMDLEGGGPRPSGEPEFIIR